MKERLISAIIAILILIPFFILGGIYFKICLTFISLVATYEVLKLKPDIPVSIKIIVYLLMILMILLNMDIIIKISMVVFTLMFLLPFCDSKEYNIEISSYLCFFIILFGVVFSYIYTTRQEDINILIYLILISVSTDTFAYLIGKPFGKHKIIEKVSPNKSVEGTISGILMGTIIPSIFYVYMVNPSIDILIILLTTLILSIISQIGDWIFSSVKRFYHVKDFSNIMPGHGGILDRFDSIIFVVIGYIIISVI